MFPFDLPTTTVFYLVLYGGTLVLHVLPMNYVLAGSTWLAAYSVWELIRGSVAAQRPIVDKLRDMMPMALAVTITAAVAPLLFLQILYQKRFYTANLLLFNRWMAILPVLIVAFYLLYLQKSKRWPHFKPALRAFISCGILGCFAFVAWSWTGNHLLSLRDQATWSQLFESREWFYHDRELLPRLLVWYVGAFPVVAAALAWQLRIDEAHAAEDSTPLDATATRRTLAVIALVGLSTSIVAGIFYYYLIEPEIRAQLLTTATWPYLTAAVFGIGVQIETWRRALDGSPSSGRRLVTLAAGIVMAVCGATALREVRRAAAVDLAELAPHHAAAFEIGGFGVFAVFLVVNAAVIAGLVVAIRRGLRTRQGR